jgi:hypothetical protein
MRMLVYRVNALPVLEDVAGFKGIRKVIDGYISRIRLDGDSTSGVSLWFDDEGIAKGLAPNLYAKGPTYLGATIYGTAVVCGYERLEDDERVTGLSERELARWSRFDRYGEAVVQ